MGILNLWSKRKKAAEKAGQPDVYQYNDLPLPLRIQIIHIWATAIGGYHPVGMFHDEPFENQCWIRIANAMCRELGRFHLSQPSDNAFEQCQKFLQSESIDHALDIIEYSFNIIESELHYSYNRYQQPKQSAELAIAELNGRFKEHGVGYQYAAGKIVRVDSQYIHAEAVKPALTLLYKAGFQGPQDEFMSAHEHYRKGKHKEAITDALKAFESTMKAICSRRKWAFDPNAPAQKLINVILTKGLIPQYMQDHLSGLNKVLEAGLPTVRNKVGGHGQGQDPVKVDAYVAAYALHMAASNIVFLMEASEALP